MHNSSSAVVSERSAGSAGQRAGASGSSFSSKRRNAAAAAAMAAAHVITPSNPQLDQQVLDLLLNPAGPRLPMQQGLPDTGFTLPRELLLNRPPKFEMLRRNVFVSRERPKRLAKNEVQVCNCR
jgi:histone-lysine N-methyltransferase SETD2